MNTRPAKKHPEAKPPEVDVFISSQALLSNTDAAISHNHQELKLSLEVSTPANSELMHG